MTGFEFPEHQGIESVNAQLSQAAQEAVNLMCIQIMRNSIQLIGDSLVRDAITYADMASTEHQGLVPVGDVRKIYSTQDRLTTPLLENDSQNAVGIVLASTSPGASEGSESLWISVEVDSDYVYPNPLDKERAGEKMYVAYAVRHDKNEVSTESSEQNRLPSDIASASLSRYVLERTEDNYTILNYTSEFDGEPEGIEDMTSIEEFFRRLSKPVREDILVAGRLLRDLRNFKLLPSSTYIMNEQDEWTEEIDDPHH